MTLFLLLAGIAAVCVVVVVILDRPFAREMAEFARRLDRLDADASRLRAERDDAHAVLRDLVRAVDAADDRRSFVRAVGDVAERARDLLRPDHDPADVAAARAWAKATPAPPPAPPCDNPACATPDVVRTGDRWYRCLACGAAMPAPPPGPELLVTDHEEID